MEAEQHYQELFLSGLYKKYETLVKQKNIKGSIYHRKRLRSLQVKR